MLLKLMQKFSYVFSCSIQYGFNGFKLSDISKAKLKLLPNVARLIC